MDARPLPAMLLILALAGCRSSQNDSAAEVVREASNREFGAAGYACADTIAQARAAGIDYTSTLQAALRKDRHALDTLFRLSGHLDAAGSQGHATVLAMVLEELGDEFFAACLAAHDQRVKEWVASDINYDLGPEGTPISNRNFSQRFPLTYGAAFPVEDRVRYLVESCRREVREGQPDYEVADMGYAAVPTLLSLLEDRRKVWVRIGPPTGGHESRFVDVEYLYADDQRPRNSIAEFALLCLCRIKDAQSGTWQEWEAIYTPCMREWTDYDGGIGEPAMEAWKQWWEAHGPKNADEGSE